MLVRKIVTALLVVALVGCVPPTSGGAKWIATGGELVAAWTPPGVPFCRFVAHVEIGLVDDTTLALVSWAEVQTLTPGLAPCAYELFTVTAWITCDPASCGSVQVPLPHLAQAHTSGETTRSMDYQYLTFHLFGHYQGSANTSYDGQRTAQVRCVPDCTFQIPSPN